MYSNLPPVDVLLDRLSSQQRQRWQKHVAGAQISGEEQTSHQVREALYKGDADEALYAVIQARVDDSTPPASLSASYGMIAQGTKADETLAGAISQISAQRAESDPDVNVPLLRQSIFGRAEPLTRPEAWTFLEKAERRAAPIAWERLHSGWDRSPILAETQFGEHATLSFRDDDGADHQFRSGPNSVLSSLWMWANHLTVTYNWPRSQAAWFLLTGDPPTLLPVTGLIESGVGGMLTGSISITALAYCSEQSVLAALRMAKRQLLGRRRGPLAEARHAMAEFVDDQRRVASTPPTWADLLDRWNAIVPPQWRQSNWRTMLDAYRKEKGSGVEAPSPEATAVAASKRRPKAADAAPTRGRPVRARATRSSKVQARKRKG